MHVSIPVTEELVDDLGGHYVVNIKASIEPTLQKPVPLCGCHGTDWEQACRHNEIMHGLISYFPHLGDFSCHSAPSHLYKKWWSDRHMDKKSTVCKRNIIINLYSVYLEGFILFKVRYRELHLWDEQMHRLFGNRLPVCPPKYYLAMTKTMTEERRTMIEHYLQENPVVSNSEIFIDFLKKRQMETFKMPSVKLILKVYLPDGKQVKVEGQSSDTADRVLEAALYKLGVSRELKEYFSLFITHKESNGSITVIKQIAHFEIPFITIWHINDDHFQIDIRKWYLDPSTDVMLMGCTAAVDLLYCQAAQELEMNWCKPTEEQKQNLQHLVKTDNKVKYLELMQAVKHYGYMVLGPCTAKLADTNSPITVSVGGNKLFCSSETGNFCLPINLITRWHVNMCVQMEQTKSSQLLEFKLEYQQGQQRIWITIWTAQAFLLSSCIKKILSEQPVTSVKENMEIVEKTTSANIFRRKQRQVGVGKKKGSCSSNLKPVFESPIFPL